jgi:hypothetical protein
MSHGDAHLVRDLFEIRNYTLKKRKKKEGAGGR